MTEKISILSLSDGDSNGDISPDVPDLDDWSVDVCREADRRLGNRKFSQWQKPRPLIRRGRSLEQLLKACQVDDDDDFDVRMGLMGPCIMLHSSLSYLYTFSKHRVS